MRRALADAIKNAFRPDGRTCSRGFWPFALAFIASLAFLFWMEGATNLRIPKWERSAFIVLTGLPFLALFFRRWHDISSSAWEGVVGVAAILLFYCLRFDLLILVVLLYFLVRLSQASAGDNRYGPRPVDRLTTFPETPLPRWAVGIQALQWLTVVVCIAGINDPRLTFSVFLLRNSPGLSRMSELNIWVKASLEKGRAIEVSRIFAAEGEGAVDFSKDRGKGGIHVLFIPPRVPVENGVCLAYPPGFLKGLGIREASYEGFLRIAAFDSSGLIAVRILGSGLFCEKDLQSRQSCLKLDEAILFADVEEGADGKQRACYRPGLERFH
jgi:uncharacterized membrane protein YhaH (DUF805 family)